MTILRFGVPRSVFASTPVCFVVAILAAAAPKEQPVSAPEPLNDRLEIWSEWGAVGEGLQCRAASRCRIEQNDPLTVAVECRSFPGHLPSAVEKLNPCRDMCSNLSLHLQNAAGELRVFPADVRKFGPAPLFDKGDSAVALDGAAVAEWKEAFSFVRHEPVLEPDRYTCFIRYAQSTEPNAMWGGTAEAWIAAGFWSGVVDSGLFALEIQPEILKTRTFLVPKRLRVIRRGSYPGDQPRLRTTYGAEDAESVTVGVRNGHHVGFRVTDGHFVQLGGPPTPDDPNAFDQWSLYRGGDRQVSYIMTLFETCTDNLRFIEPGSCGYKVLWEGRFDLALTEAELEAIQPDDR